MSVKEHRILKSNEHVDHIDNNKLNDDISNLQILTLKENNIKEAKRKGKKMVTLRCPCCGKFFTIPKNQSHLVKPTRFTACSRQCAGKIGSMLYHNPDNPILLQAFKHNVIEEYMGH